MKIEPLKDGDLLIEMSSEPSKATHGMIYAKSNDGVGYIMHSQIGDKQVGVRGKTLLSALAPNKYQKYPLNKIRILRQKDEKMRELISQVAINWDPKLTIEQAKKRPPDFLEKTAITLPTPQTFRDSDRQSQLYRNFRAYQRNLAPTKDELSGAELKATPLSKKGVSCSDFVAYSVAAAKITLLFPDGLPKNILDAIDAIEKYKCDNKKTKLSEISEDLIKNFEKNVKEKIVNDNDFKQLTAPIKGKGITFFHERISKDTTNWEEVGYFCYVVENEKFKHYVIDEEAYQKLNGSHHSMVISKEELEKIVNLSHKKIKL